MGNVIDPLDTIKDFGTDALRFTLALGTAGQVCPAFFYITALYWFCSMQWGKVLLLFLMILIYFSKDAHHLNKNTLLNRMIFFCSRTLIYQLSGWPPIRPSQTNCGMLENLYYKICLIRLKRLLGKAYGLIR